MSLMYNRLLLLKKTSAIRNYGFDEICYMKYAFVAYNNFYNQFEINDYTGEMVRYRYLLVVDRARIYSLAREWEIQESFFKFYNIYPYWFNANGDWGLLNQETGQWSGSCGMIDRDEVDYAIAVFAGTYDRSKIAEFAPANQYEPWHWLTRQPQVVSPIWNLLGLFTKDLKSQLHHNLYLNFQQELKELYLCVQYFIQSRY